ncbi:unnamed protein product [Peronospora belbahrii]|uniref:Uncharacterized protein n=1 Tax=Peronospora belbahrii TaxID=622444 RepID=A0ABN8D6D4_9STRA|nr:unnamed protein product [Peronospora belbahrii]
MDTLVATSLKPVQEGDTLYRRLRSDTSASDSGEERTMSSTISEQVKLSWLESLVTRIQSAFSSKPNVDSEQETLIEAFKRGVVKDPTPEEFVSEGHLSTLFLWVRNHNVMHPSKPLKVRTILKKMYTKSELRKMLKDFSKNARNHYVTMRYSQGVHVIDWMDAGYAVSTINVHFDPEKAAAYCKSIEYVINCQMIELMHKPLDKTLRTNVKHLEQLLKR